MLLILDKKITGLLYSLVPHSKLFYLFFESLAPTGVASFFWLIIAVFLLIFEEKKHKEFIFYFSLSIFFAFVFSNFILKPLFARPRPTTNLICPKDYSFPSGHATFSFAAASILSFFDKKRRFLYYLFALIIAYSRIYLGCHYFSDVFAGALLGYIIGEVVKKIKLPTAPLRKT